MASATKLQGKTALIAGAARNNGRVIALIFARAGADLILIARKMMKRKSGSIIALGGRASLTSEPIGAAVVATKHGLYGLIKSLALELGPYGIRANLLALSNIENTRLNPEWYADRIDNAVVNTTGGDPKDSPLGRTGTRQEVANVALFLASDDSSYVTGDRIICAGGKVM